MKCKIYRVILPVNDIEQATKFYQTVLDQPGQRVSSGRHYFDCGGVILACFDPKADGDSFEAKPNPDHIYFAVNALEEYHDRIKLARGVSIVGSIRTMPWGERSFYARDPFGNPLCFVDERTIFTGQPIKN